MKKLVVFFCLLAMIYVFNETDVFFTDAWSQSANEGRPRSPDTQEEISRLLSRPSIVLFVQGCEYSKQGERRKAIELIEESVKMQRSELRTAKAEDILAVISDLTVSLDTLSGLYNEAGLTDKSKELAIEAWSLRGVQSVFLSKIKERSAPKVAPVSKDASTTKATQAPRVAPTESLSQKTANPIAAIPRNKAEQDLKQQLAERYKDSYSTQKMLLESGMKDYEELRSIPSGEASDGVMNKLLKKYYPSFSTIKMLYKSNMEAHRELNQ